jgi:hypothetical protein
VISKYKHALNSNLKNILGWRTKRKLIVFAVDDYGNVRLHSKAARDALDSAGLKKFLRFDDYDSLETRQDLEVLFETLDSVKDLKSSPAKFTAFSVVSNIDFERILAEDFSKDYYELLPVTFEKLAALNDSYRGAWELWKEGISKGLIFPQFHGREHVNLKVFREKLAARDKEVITDLKNRSYTSISDTGYSTIDWSAVFDFWDFHELDEVKYYINDALNDFEKVFGFRAIHFNSPGSSEHQSIHNYLYDGGIRYIDSPFKKREHLGNGKYKTRINYLGKSFSSGLLCNIRNAVFEPTEERGIDWISYTMAQIETAFKWNHPAVISSHRVNYSGNIDIRNRDKGIDALKKLLYEIKKKWPDVEFLNSVELMDLVAGKESHEPFYK